MLSLPEEHVITIWFLSRADPCEKDHVSKTGLQPCFPCPRGYFQPLVGESACFLCPNNAKTATTGSTTMMACEGVTDETLAQNSRISTTELLMNECFRGPCMNSAECVSLVVGYKCHCTTGYIGTAMQRFAKTGIAHLAINRQYACPSVSVCMSIYCHGCPCRCSILCVYKSSYSCQIVSVCVKKKNS